MDVVVLVLACNDGSNLAGGGTLNPLGGVYVASTLLGKTGLDLIVVAVLVAAVLNGDDVGVVLGGKNLLVEDGLLGGVVVVLVDLLIDGGHVLLVLLLLDSFVLDGRSDLLVDSGVVMTRLGHEVFDGSFGRIHCNLKLFGNGVGSGRRYCNKLSWIGLLCLSVIGMMKGLYTSLLLCMYIYVMMRIGGA